MQDEIEDNYSDVVDDFENNDPTPKAQDEQADRGVEEAPPAQDSPKIEDELVPAHNSAPKAHSERAPSEKDDIEESEIGEEEGLNIAEKCFSKIADQMKAKHTTVINHFKDYIASQVAEAEDGKEYEIVFIPPMAFLEGLSLLGLNFTDIEIKCLMVILMKPELENVILVQDLCMVMENFGIEEDIDGITDSQANTDRKNSQQPSPDKEVSGAVDMKDLNHNLNKQPSEKEPSEVIEDEYGDDFENPRHTQSADRDVKESSDKGNFDYEPEQPTHAQPEPVATQQSDKDEDNEDLFGDQVSEEIIDNAKANDVQDDIKDEYDFDIPEDVGQEPSQHTEKVSDKHYPEPVEDEAPDDDYSEPVSEYVEQPAESEKASSRKQESDRAPSPKADSEPQGAAQVSSDDAYDEEYEKDDDQAEDQKSDHMPENIEEKADAADEQKLDSSHHSDAPLSESQAKQDEAGEDDHNDTKKKKHLKFEVLTDKALSILYTMTAYIGENEPEDLFNDYIYEQLIKTRKKQNMIELISAEDFFTVLEEHEVIAQPSARDSKDRLEKAKDTIKTLL